MRKGLLAALLLLPAIHTNSDECLTEKMAVFGDSCIKKDRSIPRRIINLVSEEDVGLTMVVGDFAAPYCLDEIDPIHKSNEDFYLAFGNHDKKHIKELTDYFEFPGNERFYSFNRDGAYFIVVNTEERFTRGSEQYLWIKRELEESRRFNFSFVFMHRPAFGDGNTSSKVRRILAPLFEENMADVVFAGHRHNYQRGIFSNTLYVVTGGGGQGLRGKGLPVNGMEFAAKEHHFLSISYDCEKMIMRAINQENQQIDEYTLWKRNKNN